MKKKWVFLGNLERPDGYDIFITSIHPLPTKDVDFKPAGGPGLYPVYGVKTKDGRVRELKVKFS
jgi:hypothetical protein